MRAGERRSPLERLGSRAQRKRYGQGEPIAGESCYTPRASVPDERTDRSRRRKRFRPPSQSSPNRGCHKATNSSCRILVWVPAGPLIEEIVADIGLIDESVPFRPRPRPRKGYSSPEAP